MERARDCVKANRMLEVVEVERDACLRDGLWLDTSVGGGVDGEEDDGREVIGGNGTRCTDASVQRGVGLGKRLSARNGTTALWTEPRKQ
jgi:hypothetical protein